MQQDFAPFGEVMQKVSNREIKKNYEVYLALYQAVTGKEEWKQIYRQFPADFFDLVVIDECHRGSAAEDSAWREVLDYPSSATHLGLTATPKETRDVSNSTYFGDPVYTYSLKKGIEDGLFAPYKVIRIATDVDAVGYTPEKGKIDKLGQSVEQRQYNSKDFDRNLVLEKRTQLVASKVWEYLKAIDRMAKTIVFCDDQDHAERMRQELVKLIPAAANNRRYVMRITGDDNEGKAQLSYFIDNDEPYPVIATTSKLLTTGVDAKTCKLIVLDQTINSMTEFKQIIGRGTRLREDYQKLYFTIMDFKGATRLFADPDFDGEPVVIYEPKPDEPVVPPEITNPPGVEEPKPPPFGPAPEGSDDADSGDDTGGGGGGDGRVKYVIADVSVRVAVERSQYLDADGRLITENYRVLLKDDIRKALQSEFGSLGDFLRRWNAASRKQAVLEELAEHGVPLDILQQTVANGTELDVFDLVAHVAFDQKPLTRRERANNVKKRDVFGTYGEQARAVLEALLDKFADHGVQDIEDAKVLELPPFDQFGSKTQIRRGIFGSVEQYTQAVHALEQALYDTPEQKQA
jgi:type I restriction enzyme R subunit